MIENDEVLESMQADILALLQNAPSIKGHVMRDNEGDFESRLEKSLGTKTAGADGKRGLAIIVLQVDVTEAEKNLPGPPLQLRARVLILENIVVNRSATKGTLQRSSQAAINTLATLHLANFGAYAIYADKAPITPQDSPDGISSHIVTLYCRVNGLGVTDKPLGVTPTIAAGNITLTCPTAESAIRYTTDGTFPAAATATLYSTPFAAPATGTTIRAAAYVTGLPPSDVLEFTIAD